MAKTSSKEAAVKAPKKEAGWQAEKSAMTRTAILDAAMTCFIEIGYANTTTALIANRAGVSRGAMMHHFPSRMSVMKAVIAYLHEMRLREYMELMADIDTPDAQLTNKDIRNSVEMAWNYVNMPSFIAYQELLGASRTDPELKAVMDPVEKDFEKQFLQMAKSVFPHWQKLPALEPAHDLVQFLMKGMAMSQMSTRRNARVKKVIDYLALILMEIYDESIESKLAEDSAK
ncbi:TetR/AcrR family transcriptional regulator [Zhongshania borealis]|jgi:AcrR family transcriptional regulator|uniref:TetR/AcrR family transcriptional regulator n=1 Tax=Zhongshania borealis TaxID=889488 RepID=A0ABP7WQI6_9GAMM